jgi:circadian clock protein KaiC
MSAMAPTSAKAYPEPMLSSNARIDPILPPLAATGIAGLDSILHGGLPRNEMHLIQGVAGTGKTTIALQFLFEGTKQGEATLYVTLSQSKEHLERIAHSHGWALDGVTVYELSPGTVAERIAARQSIFPTAEVELDEVFRDLAELVVRVAPRRAIIDSITILQLLAGSTSRYHREVVTLRQLFVERGCTLIALADHPAVTEEGQAPEVIFHPIAGCVINLEQTPRQYGDVRRRLRVVKARGLPHNGGYHDLKILTGRTEVYARLGAYTIPEDCEYRLITTQAASLDELLGGGLNSGTSCLIVGPSGVGKSSIASLYAESIARDGGKAAIFLLDERPETYLVRAEGLGVAMRSHLDTGRILLEQIDPGEVAPGQFAQRIRQLVELQSTRLVIIDSVIGYFAAMGSADVLVTQLHELTTYLTRKGVLLILCGAQEGFMSIGTQEAVDVSYLSDTILVLNFFEAEGHIRRAIAVVKKKHGTHVHSIHELFLEPNRIEIAVPALSQFRNVMVPGRVIVPLGGPEGDDS